MSKAAFSVNDLLRRKLQTSLTVATLTLSVASTLFLLLFSRRIGWGITSIGNSLTYGLSAVFSQFILFIGVLIFTVGAVITSFIIFLMMKQRTLDFGLIKAAGCPNGLVFGYFMTELLVVTCLGCVLGIVLGFASDFTITQIFHFQAYQKTQDLWLAPVVFVAFFGLCIVFGAKPMLDAARVSPIKALSPVQYFGLTIGNKLKPLSRFGLTLKLASRSFVRRQSASVRIVILLSIVFLLLTVSIAGGVIAKDTTIAWVENAMGTNVVVIAHNSMGTKYMQLLSTFTGAAENDDFNYMDTKLAVSDTLIQQLESMPSLKTVDARLMFKANVQEVSNFTIDPETLATLPVGDSREDDSLIVGVDPQKLTASWSVSGRFFAGEEADAAVIGDSISQTMFSSDSHAGIHRADPLLQGIRLQNWTFNIIGVVVDPINNGKVTYVSLEKIQNLTGIPDVNVVFVKIDSFANHSEVLAQIKSEVSKVDADFSVFELDEVRQQNLGFLSSVWAAVMLLPLFTLTSATLCLIGYSMLAVDEQRQEFAVLRIMGIKPKTIVSILAVQSLFVLISSISVGVSIGIIITLVILMSQPVVTLFSILEIVGWLSAALVGLLILSLWPAVRFAKKPILKIMS